MLNNKFIIFINDDFEPIIALAKVIYHKEIKDYPELGKVIARNGGGWWSVEDNNVLRLYGSSDDFGKYNIEYAKEAFENKRIFYFDENIFEDEWGITKLITE